LLSHLLLLHHQQLSCLLINFIIFTGSVRITSLAMTVWVILEFQVLEHGG
jgi:hypothetical protein